MNSISDLVLNNHLLRKVDAILDLKFVYELVEDKYLKNYINKKRQTLRKLMRKVYLLSEATFQK